MVKSKARKLVVCCDGTGNEIKENESNVLKLYHMLKQNDEQICFYDVGVGTIASTGDFDDFRIKAKAVWGLATGAGLDANVIEAYRFLVKHYRDGDEIFLFGFSRGAYTVRVLAAFIHMMGLIPAEQSHLISYAFRAYKKAGMSSNKNMAYRVNRLLRSRRTSIAFMGCWDTVGSVIIPNPQYGYCPTYQRLLYVNENPSVKVFRHALAIDERRRMFRPARWLDPQPYRKNVYSEQDAVDQDIKERWFAGVHSDVGGGYPEAESQLSKFPLIWMQEQAEQCGLAFRKNIVNMIAYGQDNYAGNEKRQYVAPDANAQKHDSMTLLWRMLEFLPAMAGKVLGRNRAKLFGLYIPNAEPRYRGEHAQYHESVSDADRAEVN